MKTLRQVTLAHEAAQLRDAGKETWPEYEAAYHAAGAYGEALRGLDAVCAELHTATDPERRAALRQAREWAGAFTPDVLRKLRDCPTFAGRERIRADAALRERIAATLADVARAERREAAIAKREADAELDREYKRAVIGKREADTSSTNAACRVCGWVHEGGDTTVYRHPNGKPRYTFKNASNGHRLLEYIHAGMAKGQQDVDCADWPNKEHPYGGDLRDCVKLRRQPNAHSDLMATCGNLRARIRKPNEPRQTARKAGPKPPKPVSPEVYDISDPADTIQPKRRPLTREQCIEARKGEAGETRMTRLADRARKKLQRARQMTGK
jgi:hypothetical protein